MTTTDVKKPPPAALPAWQAAPAARLIWLHLRSRRVPAALVALAACGLVLWASLVYHWWYGSGPSADELPALTEACAAAIIVVTTHNPFGEPERATGRLLPWLRLSLTLALCGAAIGFLALGTALVYDRGPSVPGTAAYLPGGILPVARNVMGFTGVGLILSLFTGGLLSWIGPLAYCAICQFAAIAQYSEPLTWASRPATDRGGWISAMVVFAVTLVAYTIRGPRVRPSAELRRGPVSSSRRARKSSRAGEAFVGL